MLNSFSALSTKVMTRPGTGVHKDPSDAAGGLTKSFLDIRLPYVRLVHYPGSAPDNARKFRKRDAVLSKWFSNNLMKLNEDKFHLLVFGTKDRGMTINIGTTKYLNLENYLISYILNVEF